MNNVFDNLREEELISLLNEGNISEEDMTEFIIRMQEKGIGGTIMAVDDPESDEGRAAVEYVEYHKQIPQEDYLAMPEKEIEWAKENIFHNDIPLEDKKRALIILAHTVRLDALNVLEKYELNPDTGLEIWIKMAIQECRGFLKGRISDRPIIEFGNVTKSGRNEICPCGSGKKFKRCCLGKFGEKGKTSN